MEIKDNPVIILKGIEVPFSEIKKGDIFRKVGEADWSLAKTDPFVDDGNNTYGCGTKSVCIVPYDYVHITASLLPRKEAGV